MHNRVYGRLLDEARASLTAIDPAAPADSVEALSAARAAVEEALDEAMAQATLSGQSVRRVAERAGLAPNTVASRLARTTVLGAYATDAPAPRVGAEELARARFDRRTSAPADPTDPATSPPPPRFQRRRPTPKEKS